jgi:hypothetical protein
MRRVLCDFDKIKSHLESLLNESENKHQTQRVGVEKDDVFLETTNNLEEFRELGD